VKSELLALHGGHPVRDTWLPYGHQSIDEQDIDAVVAALRSDFITQGPKLKEFERALADYCGARYGVAFSSGTAALHAACAAAGLRPGDEVITTPLTFVATANAVVYCGARPVFADIQEGTLNIDPKQIQRHITSKTKAIIPVDFAGIPVDLEAIRAIAAQKGLVVIEDAAHALGATYKRQRVGSLSDMTVFSFHPVKQITTGEGGMVLANDEKLAERLRIFRHHGITYRDPKYPWELEIFELGYNYRLTDFQSALGLSQLGKMEAWLTRRRAIAARYTSAFLNMPAVEAPIVPPDCDPSWHLYVIRLKLDLLQAGQSEILKALRSENIGVHLHYLPVPWHPYYQSMEYEKGQWPVAEATSQRIVSLPIWPGMTDDDVEDVIEGVSKVVSAYLIRE